MLILIPSTSLVLQTLSFNFIVFIFLILSFNIFFSLCFHVLLGYMRRLGAKNLIPLNLEIEETLRKIRKQPLKQYE